MSYIVVFIIHSPINDYEFVNFILLASHLYEIIICCLFVGLVSELEAALNMSEEGFQTKFGFDKPPEDGDDVIFYCQMGIRSLRATMFARSLGFEM